MDRQATDSLLRNRWPPDPSSCTFGTLTVTLMSTMGHHTCLHNLKATVGPADLLKAQS